MECVLNSGSPAGVGELKELVDAVGPVAIARPAHNLRRPVEGTLNTDPADLEGVVNLKACFVGGAS